MLKRFYLASHDLVHDQQPKLCEFVRMVTGLHRGGTYLLVKVSPPLVSGFGDDGKRQFDFIALGVIEPATVRDIGRGPLMADIIVFANAPERSLDEFKSSRIGIGNLFASLREAQSSLTDDRVAE